MLGRFTRIAGVRIFGALAQLGLTLMVTRVTGASEAGLFFFGYSVVMILAAIARLGSEMSGLRAVAAACQINEMRRLDDVVVARVILISALSAILAIGFCLAGTRLALTQFSGDHVSGTMGFMALTVPPLAITGLFGELFKGVGRATQGIALQNIAVPGFAVIGLAIATTMGEVNALHSAAAFALSVWLSLILSVVLWVSWSRAWRAGVPKDQSPAAIRQEIIGILRDAPTLLVVSTTSIIMQWIGAFILGFLGSPQQVAGYSVAVRLSIAVSILHSAVTSVIAPQIAAAHSIGDTQGLRVLVHQTSAYICLTTAPVLLTLLVFPGGWLSIFGKDFISFGIVLQLLVMGQIVAAVIGHSGTVLVMTGHYSNARATSIIAAVGLFIFMLFFVPEYGATGAALAMSLGVVAGHLAGAVFVRQKLGFWPMPISMADLSLIKERLP